MHPRSVRICTRVGGLAALAFIAGTLFAGLMAPTPAAAQGNTPGCEDRCLKASHEALRRCEAAGGENCAARARQAYSDCLAKCSTDPRPGTGNVSPCSTRCRENANAILRRCEAAGGENCAQRAREAYSKCQHRCRVGGGGGEPVGCAERCRAHANEALRRCEAAGGENCAERARQAYESCAAKCAVDPRLPQD